MSSVLKGDRVARACGIVTSSSRIDDTVVRVISVDPTMPGIDLFVALREAEWDGHRHLDEVLGRARGAIAIVAADAVIPDALRARCLVVPDTLVAFRAVAALARRDFGGPVIAVGGSNGKTTTKEMIAAFVEGAAKTLETMNGWSGIPATLTSIVGRDASALVVEIGIDAKGAMAEHVALVDPDVAVITSLGVEHLEGLGDLEGVVSEELGLFSSRARRVILGRDPRLRARARDGDVVVEEVGAASAPHVDRLGFAIEALGVGTTRVMLAWRGERRTFELPMTGPRNAENFALAAGSAIAVGRSLDDVARGLARFEPPPMRGEAWTFADGSIVIDDAYNASPPSMEAALELFATIPDLVERPKLLVLGDMLDLGASAADFHAALEAPLRAVVAASSAPVAVRLYGDAMRALAERIGDLDVRHVPADGDLAELLDVPFGGRAVLVKGSRGMHLERVVRAATSRFTRAFAEACAPYRDAFATVCVTGTNGKTTTTSLAAAIVAAAGEVPCRITTLGAWVGDEPTGTETSGAAFVDTIRAAKSRGVRTLAIETTSQSLGEGFSTIWPAKVAVFTNLSRDHLDYHGTPERYLAAKAQLFMNLPADGIAVLNLADPSSELLHEVLPPSVRRLGYAARPIAPECASLPVDLVAVEVTVNASGTHARLERSPLADALGGAIDLALVGGVHVENALAAALATHALGYSADAIARGLRSFRGVPGRFEIVHSAPIVVVDYAHTPDALARTLSVARGVVAPRQGAVHVVFGCGGDRDPGKREEMGEVAARLADRVTITTDNPRSEDPRAISDAIARGVRRTLNEDARRADVVLRIIEDRKDAIGRAIEEADARDIVVIAGKGHEKSQVVGDREIPFDDVAVAIAFAHELETGAQ